MSVTIKRYHKEDVSGQGVIPYFDHDDIQESTWKNYMELYIYVLYQCQFYFKLYYSYRIYNHWEKVKGTQDLSIQS